MCYMQEILDRFPDTLPPFSQCICYVMLDIQQEFAYIMIKVYFNKTILHVHLLWCATNTQCIGLPSSMTITAMCVCQDGDVVAGDGGGAGHGAVARAVQAARAQD